MLPLQITLEGFMCYLSAQTFDFRDSTLWMLTGRNGHGKSTVFDAMRWALFGVHRGGMQGKDALVHHDASAMKVEFTFALGSDTIRVTRTQTRGGKSSRQIERARSDGSAGFEAVPATETDIGFRDWISGTLGLSDATFCSAMYLGQGRADALLDSNPKERYRVLSEIVDLSAFQRLHGAADDRRIEARRTAELSVRDEEAAPNVDDETIEAQTLTVQSARQTHVEAEARVARWKNLRPAAAQWEKWNADRETAGEARARLESLLGDAPAIEAQIARLDWLERALPILEKWRQSAARHAELTTAIAARERQLGSLDARLQSAREAENTARQSVEDERETLDAARETLAAATQTAAELRPLTEQVARLEEVRAQIKRWEGELARLPADAPARARELAACIEDGEALQGALPHFKLLVDARAKWQQARAEIERAERESASPETLSRSQNALKRSQSELVAVQENLAQKRDAATLARSALENARAARRRFAEVDGATQCYVCQQPLTPAHAAREAARLEAEESPAARQDERAQAAQKLALDQVQSAQDALDGAQREFDALQMAAQAAARAGEVARRDQNSALGSARAAYGEIGAQWRVRGGGDSATVEEVLQNEFPRPRQIEEWSASVAALSELRAQREAALGQARDRVEFARRRDELIEESAPLAARFSDARAEAIGQEARQAAREIEASGAQIEATRPRLKAAEARWKAAQDERDSAQNEREPLANQLAGLGGELATAARVLGDRRAEVAPDLRAFLERDDLAGELEHWWAEQAHLESTDVRARAEKLAAARAQIRDLETRIQWIDEQIGALPEEARRAVAGIDAELQIAQAARDEAANALEAAARELANWEAARARKSELVQKRVAAETAWRRLETLTFLLGPEKLQLYLLQEAQVGIIAGANAILDRISGGTLRLELRREEMEVQGRARAESALDFVVFHQPRPDQKAALTEAPRAIYPAFLSGSQRFRVAVALALGIGRYAAAGQGAARLESVMVDEGFGSLDKQGRDEMVAELRNLAGELKRVILVSHQEDFAEAFPNRYLVEHNGRQATARLVSD